jgi:hypothetical protein
MTCRAILHGTNEISVPLLLVRNGELTPRQCDHEFKDKTGDCPTCKANIENTDFSDGSLYTRAMATLRDRGMNVSYRRFGYGSNGGVEPWRVCTWAHPPGYWANIPFRDCSNVDTDTHRVHLEVIKRYYEKEYRAECGFTIKVEQRLRRPGDPPRPYSPDLAIYGPSNERVGAVEYQRSPEAYEKFAARDDLRRIEGWGFVSWWFDDTQPDPNNERQTVYTRSRAHRDHLILLGSRPIRCWVDPLTLKLQAEYGTAGELPANRRKRIERQIEKAELRECSTSEIVKLIETGPERELIKSCLQPLRPLNGSDLNFREDANYSIERERAIALAARQRQRRLEEQDRRHRKWEAKQRILDQIRLTVADLRSIGVAVHCEFSHANTTEQLADAVDALSRRLLGAKSERHVAIENARYAKQQSLKAEAADRQRKWDQLMEERKAAEEMQESLWAKRQQENERMEGFARWGVVPGTIGATVLWRRGKPFSGSIVKWHHERPVIQDHASGKTRWAFSKDDYQLEMPPRHDP